MKIIKKFVNLINAIFICMFSLLISCEKKEVEKKETLGLRGSINNKQIQLLESNKWKLRRFKIINQQNKKIVYEKDVENMVLSFDKDLVLVNNITSGNVNYKINEFIINKIDTLTNNYYLLSLRNERLILKNDVLYYKEKKLLKHFTIELNLSTDTIKSNKDFYKVEY